MARRPTFRESGFGEASRQLNEMSKAMARSVGLRSLRAPAAILRDGMKARVSVLSGETRESIHVGKERARRGEPRVNVTASDPASVQLEFGNSDQVAAPFGRPALDGERAAMFDAFAEALPREMEVSVLRKAKRDARKAKAG